MSAAVGWCDIGEHGVRAQKGARPAQPYQKGSEGDNPVSLAQAYQQGSAPCDHQPSQDYWFAPEPVGHPPYRPGKGKHTRCVQRHREGNL